jgi:type IV pilus assembly protein PilW
VKRRAHRLRQQGLTITELMVSIAISLLVLLAATSLLLSSKYSYASLNQLARLQESGSYAIDIIARMTRQTAYVNWDKSDAPIGAAPADSAAINGLDNASMGAIADPVAGNGAIATSGGNGVNGSDILVLRFFGAGPGSNGDGSIVDCFGVGVPTPQSSATAAADRGWSIFYVATGSAGDPELRCKYRVVSATGAVTWKSEALVGGVESFQVLYGLDNDNNSMPNRFLNATALNNADNAAASAAGVQDTAGRNKITLWKRVAVIKIALLLRGDDAERSDTLTRRYDLFGASYSASTTASNGSSSDPGVQINDSDLAIGVRNRTRKLFFANLQLRNAPAGGAL